MLLRLRSMLIALSCLLTCSGAYAQAIVLTVSDSFPEDHFIHRGILFPFVQEARRKLGTGIEMPFHRVSGPQADSAMLEKVRGGTVDIGLITAALYPKDFPLTAVAELPGWSTSSCPIMIATERIMRDPGGALEREYRSKGLQPLMTVLLSHYPIVLAAPQVPSTPAGLAGLKLRTINHAMDLTVQTLGGRPVRTDPDQILAAVTQGKMAGGLIPARTVELYNMQGWVNSATQRNDFGSVVLSYVIREDRWQALPERVRSELLRASSKAIRSGCASLDREAVQARTRLEKRGVAFGRFSTADNVVLDRLFRKARARWSSEVDQSGLPGHQLLMTFGQDVSLSGRKRSK